jgi:predicted nucleic acid-binding protein
VAYYIDTSALVKLVVEEPESEALRSWLRTIAEPVVSCDLLRTELLRAVRRVAPGLTAAARHVLESLTLVSVPTYVFESAARLDPVALRPLDAIHLSAALDLGDDLAAVVTYDERLADAARSTGIEVVTPTS